MKHKDCVIKILLPWYDLDGNKQYNSMRIDARGSAVDSRRIHREVRKWYRNALGRSLRASLIKSPRFIQLIIQRDGDTVPIDERMFKDALNEWLTKIHEEDEHDTTEGEGYTEGQAGAVTKAE